MPHKHLGVICVESIKVITFSPKGEKAISFNVPIEPRGARQCKVCLDTRLADGITYKAGVSQVFEGFHTKHHLCARQYL